MKGAPSEKLLWVLEYFKFCDPFVWQGWKYCSYLQGKQQRQFERVPVNGEASNVTSIDQVQPVSFAQYKRAFMELVQSNCGNRMELYFGSLCVITLYAPYRRTYRAHLSQDVYAIGAHIEQHKQALQEQAVLRQALQELSQAGKPKRPFKGRL